MKFFSFLVVSALLFTAASCKRSNGTLELQFVGKYGQQPLLMYQEYDYEDGMKVLFQRFQFYVSDIQLLDDDGSEVGVSDIQLIDFSDIQDAAAAANGVRYTFPDIPASSYRGLRLGKGVSPFLNATSPANYLPGEPLSDNYWSAALGYIFSKIEGKADTTGSAGFTTDLTFHTGSNELYTVIELEGPFDLKNEQTLTISLEADLKRVLVDPSGAFLDFRIFSIDHHIKPEVYNFIGTNLPECLEVQN